MIFYLANGTTLCPTQADAKALDRNFVQHDIPTDKPGLMAYVQGLLDQIHADDSPSVLPIANEIVQRFVEPDVPVATFNAERVEHWIFDQATSAEVERVFTALGTRFHEMRKATQP